MIDIKTLNEVVVSLINNIHDTMPDVDTKEGTFLNDAIIYPAAKEFNDVYDNLYNLKLMQSVLTARGTDLDKLAGNYFVQRKDGTKSSGKVRFYVKNSDNEKITINSSQLVKYPDITINKYTMVTTQGTTENPAKQFQTIEEVFVPSETVMDLPRDDSGFRYIEVLCESIDVGSDKNVGPYTIINQSGGLTGSICNISNQYSFSGGSDPENDASLALRINLAITGSNIGTKDGYLSYALLQPQVLDAVVIGAGDEFMTRDIVTFINGNGQKVEQHTGGKVDIYVKTNSFLSKECEYTIKSEDLDNEYHVPLKIVPKDMIFPVESIDSMYGEITNSDGTISYKSYVNAGDYNLEKTMKSSNGKYYTDILWDFSIQTYIMGSSYYGTNNIDTNEIIRLKMKLDNQLSIAMKYINNISYKIDWDNIEMKDLSTENNDKNVDMFNFGEYTDDNYYCLQVKLDTEDEKKIGPMMFVKKEDKLYVRAYVQPDFYLAVPDKNISGSIKSLDYISWFKNANNIPELNEVLVIKYTCNNGIISLQNGIEAKRVLTADVLIKEAFEKPLEIQLSCTCSSSYDSLDLKEKISTALSYFIENQKTLGSEIDISDIIYITKSIDGIITVDISTAEMSIIGYPSEQTITCDPNEYFLLKNLILNISNSTIE